MSHSFYVLKPKSGGAQATSVDQTGTNLKKTEIMVGNPAGNDGVVSKSSTLKSGSVPAGG
jgi:hypothetical protein